MPARGPHALVLALVLPLFAVPGAVAADAAGLDVTAAAGSPRWVAARVAGDAIGVDARVNGGPWFPLAPTTNGTWGALANAPEGSSVEFRARAPDGTVESSPAYRWPEGVPVDGFNATFRNVHGNAWWIEANVTATAKLAGVDARVNGGPWWPLEPRSWGNWAANLTVPPGAVVELQARAPTGDTVLSPAYRWPSAGPADPYTVLVAHLRGSSAGPSWLP